MFKRKQSVTIDLNRHSNKSVVRKVIRLLGRGYTKSELDLKARTLTLRKRK